MLAASRNRKGELVSIVSEQLGASEKGRVLVVEANPCDLTHARIAMVGQGFTCIDTALSLRQAYDCTKHTEYQFVLIDSLLPDGDGFELLEWLDDKCEVIMLSGHSAQDRNVGTVAVYQMTSQGGKLMAV